MKLFDDLREARLSPCEKYRYTLGRSWPGGGKGPIMFVLLNPSTADHEIDDPTVRRVVNYAKCWGYDRLLLVNLFAFRATDPKVMKEAADPVGPDNDRSIVEGAQSCTRIVAAWGTPGSHLDRAKAVLELLKGYPVWCLGRNNDDTPKHPLRLAKNTRLERLQ